MKHYDLTAYSDLLSTLDLLEDVNYLTSDQIMVKGLTYNSKEVEPGTLFMCKGANFKKEYLLEAVKRGAIGYISEEQYDVGDAISSFIVSDIRKAMPYLAELFFNAPASKLKLIAVGGTKGKTTTTHFIKSILDTNLEKQGKKPSGLISSIQVFDGLAETPANNTTPEAILLHRYLANAVSAGLEYVVLEVSSQALKYNRVDCIEFDVGIFLNISKDHISPIEHTDFEDYFQSKMKMFEQTKIAVLSFDSSLYQKVLGYTNQTENVYNYSVHSVDADYYGYDISTEISGAHFKVKGPDFNEDFTLSMPGEFNVDNALAAIAATSALGIPHKDAIEGLKNVKVPGRMEIWDSKDGLLTTIVDYAHNKLSYESLYSSLRSYYSDAHITAVFGARGGKAYNRRQEFGEIVGLYADEAILTMIHPDMEELEDINNAIAVHVDKKNVPYKMIDNREEAIREAIFTQNGRKIVVVTGRGHENFQKVKGEYFSTPSDIEYVQQLMKEYDEKFPV